MMNLFRTGRMAQAHLSKSALIRLLDRELAPAKSHRAASHLERCSPCRDRYGDATRAKAAVAEYHRISIARLEPLSPAKRDIFIRQLDETLSSASTQPWWKRLRVQWPDQWRNPMHTFASVLALALALVVLSFLWRARLPAVSAAELLNRAVASDSGFSTAHTSGVLHRRLRIRTKQKTILRDLYQDISGRRQPRYVRESKEEADLAARLALAGVDWDDPLSAVSFKTWHDQQIRSHDEVQAENDGLLTIRTRPISANVAAESLTVRPDSFHPIARTVEFRDSGTVAISEISADVLGWAQGGQFFIDPAISVAPRERAGSTPSLPTEAQIDETELLARVALNRNDADSGEQIEIARDTSGVQVRGLVESKDRKEELCESLKDIPFLSVRFQSFDEATLRGDSATDASPQEQRVVIARVSPLEQYFVEHRRDRDDLSRISAGLFNSSVSIARLSRALEQIVRRFPGDKVLTQASIRARDELVSRDIANLLEHLKEQQQYLQETEIAPELEEPASNEAVRDATDLASITERNMATTRELISGKADSIRSAGQLAAELAETISQLHGALTLASNRSKQP